MKVRPADAGDDAEMERLAALATELGYPASAADVRRRLLGLDTASAAVWVAELDGVVQGWLHAAEVRTVEADPYGEIVGLVVGDGHRGAGLGAALVAAALDWAQHRGLGELRVRSNVVRERAHRFYRAQGFAESKRQAVFRRPLGPSR